MVLVLVPCVLVLVLAPCVLVLVLVLGPCVLVLVLVLVPGVLETSLLLVVVIGLELELGLDLVSGCLVIIHTYIYYFPLSLSLSHTDPLSFICMTQFVSRKYVILTNFAEVWCIVFLPV